MRRTLVVGWVSAIASVAGSGARAQVPTEYPPELYQLEAQYISVRAQAEAVIQALRPQTPEAVRGSFRRALSAWRAGRPFAAAAIFKVVLAGNVPRLTRVHALVEAGRAHADAHDHDEAAANFLQAWQMALASHQRAAAFEGFVVAAERAERLPGIPEAAVYLEDVRDGEVVDALAYDFVYRLGRVLVLHRDNRALDVLRLIPAHAVAARRAMYVTGVHHLIAGDPKRAIEVIGEAAALTASSQLSSLGPQEVARDAEVRDECWLALGRLSFEHEDLEQGEWAYRQIQRGSSRYMTALYELGWLLLDARRPAEASTVFAAVMKAEKGTAMGDEVKLLRGIAMIGDRDYFEAEAHYLQLAREGEIALEAFKRRVAAIDDVGALSRDSTVRRQARNDPYLARVLLRPEAQVVEQMTQGLTALRALLAPIDEHIEDIDRVLNNQSSDGPWAHLAGDLVLIEAVRADVDRFAENVRRAAARYAWDPQTGLTGEACCHPTSLHAMQQLRRQLEELVAEIDRSERELRRRLGGMKKREKDLYLGVTRALRRQVVGVLGGAQDPASQTRVEARARQRGRFDVASRVPACFRVQRGRAEGLRQTLTVLLEKIKDTRSALRHELQLMREEMIALRQKQDALYARLVPEVALAQVAAIKAAIAGEQQRLVRNIYEGRAGALQAIWSYKEDHRERIRELEVERKHKLDEMEIQFYEVLQELHDPL